MNYINVTAAILIHNNKILIAQRKKDGHQANKWEFPGGKIEEGESPEECLKRELWEEFNIDTKIGNYLGESLHEYSDKKIRLMGFFVSYNGETLELNAHQDVRWIELRDFSLFDFAEADLGLIDLLKANY